MPSLSKTPLAIQWLAQFNEADRELAAHLVDEVLLVGRDEFATAVFKLLDEASLQPSKRQRKLAIYAERRVKSVFGTTPAYFRNSRKGRAEGTGVQPVVADARDQEVGSEGVVAQLITDYCRRHRASAFSHPGPTKMRKEKITDVILVTDFIGSGSRIEEMLESFRYVATLRSWRSYGLIEFRVIAYAGTEFGISRLRSHKLRPNIHVFTSSPTIANTFHGRAKGKIEDLCEKYPSGHKAPFGFFDTEALIAFAHGCPNNAPALLHSSARGWTPLFKGRSAADAPSSLFVGSGKAALDQRASRLLKVRTAREHLNDSEEAWILTLIVLAAVESGAHSVPRISARTHLSMSNVKRLLRLVETVGWIDDAVRLTPVGKAELGRLRNRRRYQPVLPSDDFKFYYPTQLRAP